MNRKDHNRLFLLHANGNCKSKSISLLFFLCFVVSLSMAQTQTPPAPPPPANPFGPVGHKFNPSMAIVMVILVTAFFFMGFFSVYIRQCNWMRTHGGNRDLDGAVNFGRRSGRLARGLDPSVIESFPTFLYSLVKGLKIGKDTLECAVCLNEFEDYETLRMIPKCNHVFHPDCIDAWLSSHSTCPVCRANLVPEPDETITTCATVQVNDSDTEPENDNPRTNEISHIDVINQASDIESPDANLVNPNLPNNQNKQQRSRSTGWMLNRFFPRSHSTGHSLVQQGVNCERFTLRLPEDVRSQLMNSSLSRTLPRLSSSTKGYRSRSLGRNYFNYERFDRPDRWGFNITPFFSRLGSVRSPKPMVGNGDESSATPAKGVSKSIKSSFDRLFIGGEEDVGERSSDQLRSESHV